MILIFFFSLLTTVRAMTLKENRHLQPDQGQRLTILSSYQFQPYNAQGGSHVGGETYFVFDQFPVFGPTPLPLQRQLQSLSRLGL